MKMLLTVALLMGTLFSSSTFASEPDLRSLKEAGDIIHSEVAGYSTDKGWLRFTRLMQNLSVFDRLVKRMSSVLCSAEVNKSVLLIGEPSDTYRYLFARLAKMTPEEGCKKLSHVNIEVSNLQGYMYVGTTERLWQDRIERPAYDKDVVLYFPNIAKLIGIGTAMNKETGIEATYVNAIETGKLKSVAFINKILEENLHCFGLWLRNFKGVFLAIFVRIWRCYVWLQIAVSARTISNQS